MTVQFRADATILFIGDSITDVGRDRRDDDDLGEGYPALIADRCTESHQQLHFINRGIGGNRIRDLAHRWESDCLNLYPDVISILIGINDTFGHSDGDHTTTTQTYEAEYRSILQRSRAAIPGVQFILIDPFLLPVRDGQRELRQDLNSRITVVHRLADDVDATLVPADALLTRAAECTPARELCPDGVHPSPAGHSLLAHAWLRCSGLEPSAVPACPQG